MNADMRYKIIELCFTSRAAIVPVANIGSTISFPLILIGVLFSWNQTLINMEFWLFISLDFSIGDFTGGV